jgi:hypothetical protein
MLRDDRASSRNDRRAAKVPGHAAVARESVRGNGGGASRLIEINARAAGAAMMAMLAAMLDLRACRDWRRGYGGTAPPFMKL